MTTLDLGPGALPGRLVAGPVPYWYRDLVSCLQATFATVLLRDGHDPLEVLGSHWEFRWIPGDVRSEEFYYPCRYTGDLGRSLAPRHPVRSAWQRPTDPADPLAEIRSALAADRLVIAAVDNFHLPFRPAFGDVHAAHLVVVFGLDERRGLVYLSDAMPPAFSGPVSVPHFLAAWSSANPADEQDDFFSDAGIDRRLLDVTLAPNFPRCDAAFLRETLQDNREQAAAGDDGPGRSGLSGLAAFTAELRARARAGDGAAVAEVYPYGWGMQAQAALHAELLRRWGTRHDVPEVREAGRLVESVAHAWTGLRITAAHGRRDPVAAAAELDDHAAALRRRYEVAIEGITRAEEAL